MVDIVKSRICQYNNILMKFSPLRLIVEVTTDCKLSCQICPKQSPNYHQEPLNMGFEVFKNLETLFPKVKSLVLSGFGEPLMHPNIIDFITFARRRMSRNSSIGIQTNGVLLDEKILKELTLAGLDRICISIDSLLPINGLHEPRYGKNALEILSKFKKERVKKLSCGIQMVITKKNLYQILPTIKESLQYGIEFIILSHLIPYSPVMQKLVAYETNNEKAVRIFKRWLKRLHKRGYTVQDWIELFKRRALPNFFQESTEFFNLYRAMYEEAEQKGITLNINNLIQREENYLNEVRRILREVSDLSKERKLRIQIPRVNPAKKRKCDFIEKKCIFVGVDGEISPCYFLWHNFTCYVAGLKKSIKRWTFGNIKQNNPLNMLNSEDYLNFVNSVLKYDFPYCYDCNFALCDLMELEDFIYDCYANDVPCGACLWCGGLFYCMI